MKYIPAVTTCADHDMIFVPIVDCKSTVPTAQARFQWKAGEGPKEFLNRYRVGGSGVEKKKFFFSMAVAEDRHFEDADLEIFAWKVLDEDLYSYYLLCFDELEDYECVQYLFCIPLHYFNLLEVYRHYKTLYEFMI